MISEYLSKVPFVLNTHTIKPLRSGQLSNKNSIVGPQNSIVRASIAIFYIARDSPSTIPLVLTILF